ncbi:hypothetical protein RIR_jg31190.t1 [Rhizophagus irregularis DAOM 181602=DAOM 197198]|nr:hypothetical protein RIR_jg31190.t1 [Rhizophagus irregularis DAOM 181602=DAOM 197198]
MPQLLLLLSIGFHRDDGLFFNTFMKLSYKISSEQTTSSHSTHSTLGIKKINLYEIIESLCCGQINGIFKFQKPTIYTRRGFQESLHVQEPNHGLLYRNTKKLKLIVQRSHHLEHQKDDHRYIELMDKVLTLLNSLNSLII